MDVHRASKRTSHSWVSRTLDRRRENTAVTLEDLKLWKEGLALRKVTVGHRKNLTPIVKCEGDLTTFKSAAEKQLNTLIVPKQGLTQELTPNR